MIVKNEFFYEKKYEVRYSDMDYKKCLKPSALLNFLQDLATIAAEKKGFGYSFVSERNYAWFLLKYHMEFVDYPSNLDEIVIRTEARGYTKLFANRDFEIYTTEGKFLGRVVSLWAMIDLNTKNMLNLKDVTPSMPAFEKREDDLGYEKIKQLENVDFEEIFKIRFDDIDVNRHVNNVNYVIWATEVLPYEFKSNHKLKQLEMVYKKEIQFGHNVISQAQFDEEGKVSTHILKNQTTNEELCLVKMQFI